MRLEEKTINNNYICRVCKTENNKWHKLFYESDGKMLIEVRFSYVSFCKTCNTSQTMFLTEPEESYTINLIADCVETIEEVNCIRCLEKDKFLLLNNYKEGVKFIKLNSKEKEFMFDKVNFFPICVPCVLQLKKEKQIHSII